MEVCLGYVRNEPQILRLEDEAVFINGEIQALKGVTKSMLEEFSATIAAVPYSTDQEGYKALLNAKRVAFLASLLGYSVGDDCVDTISAILDSVHYEVLQYLGEVD